MCSLPRLIPFSIIHYFDSVIAWVMVKFITEETPILALPDYDTSISVVYCIMILGHLIQLHQLKLQNSESSNE